MTPSGEQVSFRVNDEHGGTARGMRVFAGVRWDPFIMDARRPWRRSRPRQLAFTDPGSIFLDGKNVLSIVVEIDTRCSSGWTLVGVVAETLTRGEFNVRIERVGRPEVKNMMLAPGSSTRSTETSRSATSTTWTTRSTSRTATSVRTGRD